MRTNLMLEQKDELSSSLLQQFVELQNKYHFQLMQNKRLLQQNKRLQQELNIANFLNKTELSRYCQPLKMLMQLMLSPTTLRSRLTMEEWRNLFEFMDILYGNTLRVWLRKYDCLSKEEIALCYFCFIGIKHPNLAVFWGISSQSLSKRKQRLKNKLGISQFISLNDIRETKNFK